MRLAAPSRTVSSRCARGARVSTLVLSLALLRSLESSSVALTFRNVNEGEREPALLVPRSRDGSSIEEIA